RLTVVGARRMATFDDMLLEGKLAIYDKGFDEDARSWGEYIARSGDIFSPRISNAEPLRVECEHFLHCIRTGATPRSDGRSGVRVVRVLEELQRSLTALRSAAGRRAADQAILARRRSTLSLGLSRARPRRRSARSTGPTERPTP